jgi:hypothetical protein
MRHTVSEVVPLPRPLFDYILMDSQPARLLPNLARQEEVELAEQMQLIAVHEEYVLNEIKKMNT